MFNFLRARKLNELIKAKKNAPSWLRILKDYLSRLISNLIRTFNSCLQYLYFPISRNVRSKRNLLIKLLLSNLLKIHKTVTMLNISIIFSQSRSIFASCFYFELWCHLIQFLAFSAARARSASQGWVTSNGDYHPWLCWILWLEDFSVA